MPGLDGIFAPKVEQAIDVLQYDALLDHFESRNGVTGLEYIVPVETVQAIQNASEIASASPRVGAMIGPTAEHADIAERSATSGRPRAWSRLYHRTKMLLATARRASTRSPGCGSGPREPRAGSRSSPSAAGKMGFRGQVACTPPTSRWSTRCSRRTPSDRLLRGAGRRLQRG